MAATDYLLPTVGNLWQWYQNNKATKGAVNSAVGGTQQGLDFLQKNANKAIDLTTNVYNQTRGDLKPYGDIGLWGTNKYKSLLQNPMSVRQDPGYQFGLNQGTDLINRRAAATGNRYAGSTLMELNKYGQDYADTRYDESLNRYKPLIDLGSTTSTNMANLGSDYARGVGNIYMGLGEAGANAYKSMGEDKAYGKITKNDNLNAMIDDFTKMFFPGAAGVSGAAGIVNAGKSLVSGAKNLLGIGAPAAGAAAGVDPLSGILNPTGGAVNPFTGAGPLKNIGNLGKIGAGAIPLTTPGGASLISAGGPGMAPVYEGGTQAIAGAAPGSSVLGSIGSIAGPLAAMYGGVQALKWLGSDSGPFGTGGDKPLKEDLAHAVKSYGNNAPTEIFKALTGDPTASNKHMLEDTTKKHLAGKWMLLNTLTQSGMFDKSVIDSPMNLEYVKDGKMVPYKGAIWDFPYLYRLDERITFGRDKLNRDAVVQPKDDKLKAKILTDKATEVAGGKSNLKSFLTNIIAKSKDPEHVRIAKLALGGVK